MRCPKSNIIKHSNSKVTCGKKTSHVNSAKLQLVEQFIIKAIGLSSWFMTRTMVESPRCQPTV